MRLIDVKREQMIDGMDAIIRRVCRLGPRGDFILMYDEMSPRELAIKLLSFVEGRDPEFVVKPQTSKRRRYGEEQRTPSGK